MKSNLSDLFILLFLTPLLIFVVDKSSFNRFEIQKEKLVIYNYYFIPVYTILFKDIKSIVLLPSSSKILNLLCKEFWLVRYFRIQQKLSLIPQIAIMVNHPIFFGLISGTIIYVDDPENFYISFKNAYEDYQNKKYISNTL